MTVVTKITANRKLYSAHLLAESCGTAERLHGAGGRSGVPSQCWRPPRDPSFLLLPGEGAPCCPWRSLKAAWAGVQPGAGAVPAVPQLLRSLARPGTAAWREGWGWRRDAAARNSLLWTLQGKLGCNRHGRRPMSIGGCSPRGGPCVGGEAGLWWSRARQEPQPPPELFSAPFSACPRSASAASSQRQTPKVESGASRGDQLRARERWTWIGEE